MKTNIWKKLPSDAGVTFEGFKNIRLEKREKVRKQLEDFLEYCKSARSPALRVILGEWGEGKTDAYKRYIHPRCEANGNLSFFVSASTLSQSFDLPQVRKILETTPLPAVRFLVALFVSIRQEEKEKLIPPLHNFTDAESYLDNVFKCLIGDKKLRIFVFIDEFEELLLYPPKLKQIISGIKEAINGQYVEIFENGKYEGCLHLIIAATPDAYYQLQVREETSLIFGGLGRRAGVIELPEIRKSEGMEFLFSLLRYCYENKLPEQLPFRTSGIFHAIFRITQGNPGNMVSLFTRLLNSAKIDNESVKIIDFEHFLKFLEKQRVFVYGGSTPCLEQRTFTRMLSTVEDQKNKEIGLKCGSLLKLLTGELRPFSVNELCARLGSREKDVKQYVNIINNDLKKRENINRTIIKVAPLRDDKSLKDVEALFREYITVEKEKKWIKIDNYSESLEDFRDKITYFDIDAKEIKSKIFLPVDKNNVKSFFEGVSPEKAVELSNIILRKLCKQENYYLISEEFLSQVYPTPIPRELEFIRNRELRWKLWREVRKNLSEQFNRYMPDAFIYVLEKSGLFNIAEIRKLAPNLSFNELVTDKLNINMCFFAVNGDIKASDIEEISKWIKQTKPPIHCFVVIYTGDITYDAKEKIINKELGKDGQYVIVDIKLHPTLARRIICTYRASQECRENIREDLFNSVIRKIVNQEINFLDIIRQWLFNQEEKGVVIKEIDTSSELSDFTGALKFYINFIEKCLTPDEIFEKNQKELLDKFVWYGSRIGIIPDIEKPKFKEITKDLLINGFLEKKEGKYLIKMHPVEKRILKLLEKEKKISEKELKTYFIMKNEKFLKKVFLPILEYKGLIRKESDFYILNDVKTFSEEVKHEYQVFRRRISAKKGLLKYGYIFLWKKHKQTRFITLEDFSKYFELLYQSALTYSYELDETRALQKFSLLKNLLGHFNKRFLPVFEEATTQSEKIINELMQIKSNFEHDLSIIKDECAKWLKIEFKIDNVSEYKSITTLLENITEIDNYGYSEVKERIIDSLKEKEKEKFYFDEEKEKTFYFNPKLYKISSLKEDFMSIIEKNNPIVKSLMETFQDFNERVSQIENEIKTITVDENLIISKKFLSILKRFTKDISPNIESLTYERVTLRQIKKTVDETKGNISSTLEEMEKCLAEFRKITEKEEQIISNMSNWEKKVADVKEVFDIVEYKGLVKELAENKKRFRKKYKELSKMEIEDINKLLQYAQLIEETLEELSGEITKKENELEQIWRNYVEKIKEFTKDMEKILDLTRKRYKITYKDLSKKLEELEKTIGVQKIGGLKLSDIEQLKENIHAGFYQRIQQFLSEKEIKVLELIMKETEKTVWIPRSDLSKMVIDKLKIKRKEADEILEKLMREGLLKVGITLAF